MVAGSLRLFVALAPGPAARLCCFDLHVSAIGVAYLDHRGSSPPRWPGRLRRLGDRRSSATGCEWIALVTAVQELTSAAYQARVVLALLEALRRSAMPGRRLPASAGRSRRSVTAPGRATRSPAPASSSCWPSRRWRCHEPAGGASRSQTRTPTSRGSGLSRAAAVGQASRHRAGRRGRGERSCVSLRARGLLGADPGAGPGIGPDLGRDPALLGR